MLQDDAGFFPAYNVAPVFDTETLREYPQLKSVFDRISPKLTSATLRKLNYEVDVAGKEPADVAADWMVHEGFITRG